METWNELKKPCDQLVFQYGYLILYYLDSSCPINSSVLKWKYKKKIEKVIRRYFGGARRER